MRGVPARQGERADIGAAAHDVRDVRPDERCALGDVDRDDGRPIRALVPRKQISRQAEREHEEQQHDAGRPRNFSRALVRAEKQHAQQMQHGEDHDEAGAEEMKPAQHAAELQLRHDETQALVRVCRHRHVVHRQRDAGDELQRQEEQQHAAEREKPVHVARHRLVENAPQAGSISSAIVEPVAERHQSWTKTFESSTRAAISLSGRGGGPETLRPSGVNTPPWQGHLINLLWAS